MDSLRTLVSGLFKLTLNLCTFLLLITFTISGMLQDGISSLVVSNPVVDEMFTEMGVDGEKVYELVKSDEVKEFVSGYVNPILGGGVDVENVNIGSDIVTFVTENKAMIEETLGEPLPMDKVYEFANSEDVNRINDTYRDIVTQTGGEVDGEENNVVGQVSNIFRVVNFLGSKQFKIILGLGCLFSIVFIALVERSFHSWMKSVGKTLAGCGFIIGIMSFFGSTIISKVFGVFGLGNVTIDIKHSLTIAIVSFVIGIVLLIVHSKVNRYVQERSALNEVSNLLRS